MPLPAIPLGLSLAHEPDQPSGGNAPPQMEAAVAEYAEALRGAGFHVVTERHHVIAWQFVGDGPSIRVGVDGSADLDSCDAPGVRGRLAQQGWRPTPNDAVVAAQQWLIYDQTPDAWTAAT